jgi:hypothetical protein
MEPLAHLSIEAIAPITAQLRAARKALAALWPDGNAPKVPDTLLAESALPIREQQLHRAALAVTQAITLLARVQDAITD